VRKKPVKVERIRTRFMVEKIVLENSPAVNESLFGDYPQYQIGAKPSLREGW
jgi:hypothetical protein